ATRGVEVRDGHLHGRARRPGAREDVGQTERPRRWGRRKVSRRHHANQPGGPLPVHRPLTSTRAPRVRAAPRHGGWRRSGHASAHGGAETPPSDLTLSSAAWFNERRDDAAPDRDPLLLSYRGPGGLSRPESRRDRPSSLTRTQRCDPEAREADAPGPFCFQRPQPANGERPMKRTTTKLEDNQP